MTLVPSALVSFPKLQEYVAPVGSIEKTPLPSKSTVPPTQITISPSAFGEGSELYKTAVIS